MTGPSRRLVVGLNKLGGYGSENAKHTRMLYVLTQLQNSFSKYNVQISLKFSTGLIVNSDNCNATSFIFSTYKNIEKL